MEQAILAMQGITLTMIGVIVTLMLYLDRGRRADIAQLRTETNEGFKEARAERAKLRDQLHSENAKLRDDMNDGNAKLRDDMNGGNAKLRDDMNGGFKHVHTRLDKLTDVVMDLCRRVGRLEGRAEVSEPETDTPQ